MGFQIVERLTDLSVNGGRVTVTSDSSDGSMAIEELNSKEAREFAVNSAAKRGVANPRVGGMIRPYPVDKEGNPVMDQLVQGVAAYRAEIPISSAIL